MKTSRAKMNWIIDALLMGIFLALFFLDLTGLALHQWLGIGIGLLAAVHLLMHGQWVATVTERFFTKISNQCRVFYLLDAALFFGFGLMMATGLLISTWLNLPLPHYPTWKALHVFSAVATLLATLFKLSLHWKALGNAACRRGKTKVQTLAQPVRTLQPAQTVNMERRGFLKAMGITGAVAMLGMIGAARSISHLDISGTDQISGKPAGPASGLSEEISSQIQTAAIPMETESKAQASPTEAPVADSPEQALNPTEAPIARIPTQAVIPTQAPIARIPTQAVIPTNEPIETCVVRCPNGCSFPGRCRRYTDADGDQRCDLGECV